LPAVASEFLKAPPGPVELLSKEDIRTSLLEEVEGSLGAGSATNRLAEIKEMLRPVVLALPKNEHGNLGHAAVGYALHRLFVLRHGWHIQGLDSKANVWNASSPAGVLSGQVPSYIEDLFEERLAGKGYALNDIAVLASTIEHLIHNEAVSRLGNAFEVHGLPVVSPLDQDEATEVLDTYMLAYILGQNIKNLTFRLDQRLKEKMSEIFYAWPDTQKFVREIQKNVTETASEADFASLAKVVDVVGERFGSFQDLECHSLKAKLLKMEFRGTGRVLLSDFYKPALDGVWTFQESSAYLRSLGLLDESDPTKPSLIIANYLTSEANCIASSGFYKVCCKNECEGLLGELEKKIGSYEATPKAITDIVLSLPSSTVTSKYKVSGNLLQRLDDIAARHHGMVPLHGRLFSQWMHHVYPRECPYPHSTGTSDSELPEEYIDGASPLARASEDEMMQFVAQSANDTSAVHDLPVEELMPWSSEEELFVVHSAIRAHGFWNSQNSSPATRSMALIFAAGSLSFGLLQSLKQGSGEGKLTKYTV